MNVTIASGSLQNQRDRVASLKQETLLNLEILHAVHPIPAELHRQLFKENVLEKPNQHIFLHLTHYLIRIITPANSLPWPLYDSSTERAYKKELANILAQYQTTGLVSPIISSYFVNPGCFKVLNLMFQISVLAIETVLPTKTKTDYQKDCFREMYEKFHSNNVVDFEKIAENVEKRFHIHIHNHISYKKKMERIAAELREQILSTENECKNIQNQIDSLVDSYLEKCKLELDYKTQIEEIKDISKPATFFDTWHKDLEAQISAMESKWQTEVTDNLLKSSQYCFDVTKSLIARHTGEADRKLYTIEYDPMKDTLNTTVLESISTSQQKHILKNIIKDGRLHFPFLIRGFIVSVCYILKDIELDDDIYEVAEYLGTCRRNIGEALIAAREMTSKLISADAALQLPQLDISDSSPHEADFHIFSIPPLPDLSIHEDHIYPYESFTPLNIGKRNFIIQRKYSLSCIKQPRTLLHTGPGDEFLKNIISCRVSTFDCYDTLKANSSTFPIPSRMNETVSDCSSGFSKQQMMRLLSTKKKSSTKKRREKHDSNVKVRGSLFDTSVDSILFRSHSSPNLFENRDKKSTRRFLGKELSPMLENSSCFSEISGINPLDNSKKLFQNSTRIDSKSIEVPKIEISEVVEKLVNFDVSEKATTPVMPKISRKSTSIEKIINRYKRIRASVCQNKDAIKEDYVFSSNKRLLPDLLSPTCSVSRISDAEWDIFQINQSDEISSARKPRESLGTALGVDNTFLDQFDFID